MSGPGEHLLDEQAAHLDKGKSAVTSIPAGFILEIGEVFEIMKKQYPDLENGLPNYTAGYSVLSYIGSALRHLLKLSFGDNLDEQTGKSHAAHCACNLAIVWFMLRHKPIFDDRFKA